jgi:hypothetical protein
LLKEEEEDVPGFTKRKPKEIFSPKIATNKNAELNACVSELCNYRARVFLLLNTDYFFSDVKC